MKLLTTIRPRADGTVIVDGVTPKGFGRKPKKYIFEANDDGVLVCDVEDDASVVSMLASGNFEPANDEDLDVAETLLTGSVDRRALFRQSAAQVRQVQIAGADGLDDDDGDDDDPIDPYDGDRGADVGGGALPVEANTPPKPGRKRPATADEG